MTTFCVPYDETIPDTECRHWHDLTCHGLSHTCKGCPMEDAPPMETTTTTTKTCKDCGVTKPIESFCSSKASKDGKRNVCRACDSKRHRENKARAKNGGDSAKGMVTYLPYGKGASTDLRGDKESNRSTDNQRQAETTDGENPEQLAAEHWSYISALLSTHGETEHAVKTIGFHYRTAFIHGYKHARETTR